MAHRPAKRSPIEIADTGCGILEEIRDRILEPFFATTDVGQGSGQGLVIAQSMIDNHGGALSIEGNPGDGATFTVKLPLAEEAVLIQA